MDEELRFDYNDYWTPEKLESNYVEESYDEPTDQDFWELHKFVLECELDICDGIYTESVGSVVRNTVGAIIDQIIESFLRICEAFGKQSMKSAVKWLKKNKRIIEHLGETESVHTILESLASIKNHYERIEAYARAFDNCSNVNNIPDEKLGKKVCEVIESLENDKDEIYSYENRKTRELDTSKISVSKLIDDVVGKLESGEYSKWRKFAQNLRSRMRKVIRAGLMDDILTDQFKTMDVARVPQRILWEFDSITANIKRLKKECDEASKELKIKKKSGQSVTESYYVEFEPEVDILF